MNNKGFSLVELVVIIGIIGILAAIGTVNFNTWRTKAQIESQTRELFSDFNKARIDSMHRKMRHRMVIQPYSYVLKNYSSDDENDAAGAIIKSKDVSYMISRESGTALLNYPVEFNIRGFTTNNSTFRINPVGTGASVDCIVIAIGRTNLGKMENGSCVVK